MKRIFTSVFRISLALELLVFAAILALAPDLAQAQGYGSGDLFAVPRYIVLDPGTQTPATSAVTVSNAPVDIHGYDGIAVVICSSIATNSQANAAVYARIEGSQTGTNGWALLTNCAQMVLSTNILTNLTTAVTATNTYLLPNTPTTPTAATSGFAGLYMPSPSFTSTSVLITNVASGVGVIGFSVADVPRYIHVVYTVTGETNQSSCFFIGRKNSGNLY